MFPIVDLDPEYFARLINVNVVGTFHCLKEEMKVIKDGGSIVNIGSVASQFASQGVSAYVAAKHALIGLTKVGSACECFMPVSALTDFKHNVTDC